MSDTARAESDSDNQPVPTVEEERDFLARCEYVNRLIATAGRFARKLLRERGWDTVWCEVDQEEVWRKTFDPDNTQHLSEWDAYDYEEEHCRQFFRDARIAMAPRKPKG
jgi:hypothetical protein